MFVNKRDEILIIGAGLCGSLLALRLAQRGYQQVTLVEKRSDLRLANLDAGRSINLALSDRGLTALKMAGMDQKALAIAIPMHGRMIHQQGCDSFFSPYSGNPDTAINSISRPGLNALLLDAIDHHDNVTVHFDAPCVALDLELGRAEFQQNSMDDKGNATAESFSIESKVIFGCDGAGSLVRKTLQSQSKEGFDFSLDWLSHGYKELSIAPGADGEYQIREDALHIWPRGEDMVIALPNLDKSFTVTLFMSHTREPHGFDHLKSDPQIRGYFQEKYPVLLELIPDIVAQYQNNPTGPLGTIKCSPWNAHDKALIMGDAAHAIVPFYGQGMNASFEDVLVFDRLMDSGIDRWSELFDVFANERKKDADAIANLALDNFYEMKEHTADPIFQRKRAIEVRLEQERPMDYQSKYSMVTFKPELSYHQAMTRGRAQDKAIEDLLRQNHLSEAQDLDQQLRLINEHTQSLLEQTKPND